MLMRHVGTIREIWRYPVSSIGGEVLQAAQVGPAGMTGDRLYALVEVSTGIAAHPERDERWCKAIFLRSRTIEEGEIEIFIPGGDWLSIHSPDHPRLLSTFFGFEVEIRPYRRTGRQGPEDRLAEHRYDVSPLHMLTSASVDHLETLHPGGNADRRRFRPNVYVEAANEVQGFAELGWINDAIRFGDLAGKVIAPTKRCGFTILAQDGLEHDAEILRNIMRHGAKNMGVYCRPDAAGTIRTGNAVYLTASFSAIDHKVA